MAKRKTLISRIGPRLKQLRKARGLGQKELGDRAALSAGYIGYLEQGIRVPAIDALERMCQAMRVSLAEFFSFDESADEVEELRQITVLLRDRDAREILKVRCVAEIILEK